MANEKIMTLRDAEKDCRRARDAYCKAETDRRAAEAAYKKAEAAYKKAADVRNKAREASTDALYAFNETIAVFVKARTKKAGVRP
jgi:hypothetical protein